MISQKKNYNVNKEIKFKRSILRSDLYDFSDAYIVVKGTITTEGASSANKDKKKLAFKNNAPFINCSSKINGTKIGNAEDLHVVMPMYNLLEYTKNYKKTTGSLWNYYRDEPSNPRSTNSESFKYKTSIVGNTYNVDLTITNNEGNPILNPDYDANRAGTKETEIVIPLKHLSNFWRSLDILLINCEVELILTWSKNCALADMTVRAAGNDNKPPAIVAPTGLEFQRTDTKLYVAVVTLSRENKIKLIEKLKSGFKKAIKWNKYMSQMTIQNNNNNLNYLIDQTFTNVNRLFVLSFPRNNNTDCRYSYSNYYVPKVKISGFNVLIDGKSFFDLPAKNDEEAYGNIVKMSNNNNNTRLVIYYILLISKKNYKLIAIDLSKQTKIKDKLKK